jgi:hypothetical protein
MSGGPGVIKTIWRASLWLAMGLVLCANVESYLLPIRVSRSFPWKSNFELVAWSERGSAYIPLFRGFAPRGPNEYRWLQVQEGGGVVPAYAAGRGIFSGVQIAEPDPDYRILIIPYWLPAFCIVVTMIFSSWHRRNHMTRGFALNRKGGHPHF